MALRRPVVHAMNWCSRSRSFHHLSIAGNVPLANIAQYLGRLGGALIIEFVPRDDPAIAEMADLLARRPLIEAEYSQEDSSARSRPRFESGYDNRSRTRAGCSI